MKKIIFSLCAVLMLSLGHLAAQKVLVPIGNQDQLELRQMEAFQGLTEAIPYQNKGLSAYIDLSQKMDFTAKMRPLSENAALQKAFKANKQKNKEKASLNELTIDTTLTVDYWGTLTSVEDGNQLFFTVEFAPSPNSNWYYSGATYTFFDENFKPGKSFSLNTPIKTQEINIMGNYTTRFFNYDANKEFLVSVHSFDPDTTGPASCRDTLFIINENGEILRKFGHTSGAFLHSVTKNGYPENRIQLIDAFYSNLADTMKTFIYTARDVMQDNPQPLYTFNIVEDLTTYSNGVLAAFTEIEGEPCYITTQYKKCFVADDNHSGEEINVEKDNLFEVYIYDIDFNLVKKIELPLIGLEDNEFSMSTLMYFGKYMITRHVFNQDDKYEIIYAMDRYDYSCDCNKMDFYLMDEDGNKLKEIAEEVSSVIELQSILGQHDEFALAIGDEDEVTGFTMIDIPSLNVNYHFPALYKNELLSMSFDRVPAAGGYNYVFGLGRGESADNTVYGGIVYYDRQGEIVKRHRIDLGNDALLFTPIINSLTINPYAFIPDEQQEYLYFYRFSKNGAAGKGFGIANENETLYKWQDNDQDGSFYSAGLTATQDGTELKNLYVTWQQEDGSIKNVFYKMPLKKIELQGEGTKASPYIITSPGELDMVRYAPDAWYILGNDIDMAAFTGVNYLGFKSIPKFTGNLDGKGHFIENITINGTGIFKDVEGGKISNLSVRNVAFSTKARSYVGVIAGTMMMESKLFNCHVEGSFEVNADKVGGLVGQAVTFSMMERCSFTGHISGSSENVGGIVGDMRTSSTVYGSYVKGSVSGSENVGGIVGSSLNGIVENSYSSAAVYASAYMAGGVVGENNGGHIRHTYATGKVEVDVFSDSKWFKGTAGGIAGYTVPNSFGGQIKYSFALNDTVMAPNSSYRVASVEYYKLDDGEKVIKSLDSNFALGTMRIGSKNALHLVSDDTCVMDRNHGQSGTLETFNQAFYEKYTWRFGKDSAAPWQMTGNKPTLWWETVVRGVSLSARSVSVGKDETLALIATVIPAEATDKTLLWSSADPKVATVDQQGVVTGKSVGKTVVTVKTPDGLYEAACEVSVIIPVKQVIFPDKEIVVSLETTVPLSVTVLPEDATNPKVIYQSLNPAIALTGGPAVYGVELGTTQLVAISEQSGVSDTCTVYVVMPITGIVLNESSLEMDKETPTFQLEATIYPTEAANSPLRWKSDDTKVAEVTNTGLVYARDKGETTITASSFDGKVSAVCFVTVTEFVSVDNENNTQVMVGAYAANNRIVVTASCGMEWIKVYNLSGQCVAQRAARGEEKVTLDAAKLPQGFYLLQVGLPGGRTATAKVVK